jgi:hypothetical protein
MFAPGPYTLIVHSHDSRGMLSRVQHIDACDVSSRSYFPAVDFVDEIKGATVPRFDLELVPGP